MSNPNTITVAGNLTAEPTRIRTSSEVPMTTFRVAVSKRIRNAETGTWEDRQDGFFNVKCWRELARHAGQSLRKGDRVVVVGRLVSGSYESVDADGQVQTRYTTDIEAEELGASFRWGAWAPVQVRALVAEPDPFATTDVPSDGAAAAADGGQDASEDQPTDVDVTAAA